MRPRVTHGATEEAITAPLPRAFLRLHSRYRRCERKQERGRLCFGESHIIFFVIRITKNMQILGNLSTGCKTKKETSQKTCLFANKLVGLGQG